MRSLTIYLLALACAAVAGAQIVLDPSPARVMGHPVTTPAEQLVVTNINPNFGVNGGLYSPRGVAIDTSSSPPILYVSDTYNHRILAWKNAGSTSLSNLQAPDLIIGQPDACSTLPTTNGGFNSPTGLVADSKGNLYVADSGNNRVLRYPSPFSKASGTSCPSGASTRITSVRPDIVIGQPDFYSSKNANQGGKVSANTLNLSAGVYLVSLAIDSSGDLFVTDGGNSRVLQFASSSLTSGATNPAASLVIGQAGFTTVTSPANQVDRNLTYQPAGLAFDSAGRLFVTDAYANRLLVYAPPFSNGMAASRIAGVTGCTTSGCPSPSGATASTLSAPQGIAMVNDGPAVMDTGNNRLLFFDPYSSSDWGVTSGDKTLANPPPIAIAAMGQGSSLTDFTSNLANAGNPQASFPNSGAKVPTFNGPASLAVAPDGDLFVADTLNHRVLVYPTAGKTIVATAVLGQSDFPYNSPNSIHGREFFFGTTEVSSPTFDAGLAIDSSGSTPHLYVSDPNNHRVLGFADARKIGLGVQADIVIGEPDMATALCNFGGIANPGNESLPRQPTQSSLCYPTGVAVDPANGNLYVADSANGRVLRFPAPFAAANSSHQADLVLGQAAFTGVSNPQASQSVMIYPYGLVFDKARGLFVSDVAANRVLVFQIANASNGENATAVIGQSNFSATSSSVLYAPHHIAEDSVAELYVADTGHNQIQIFNIPTGSSSNVPVASFTGLSSPEAVWVNQSTVSGYHNDIWVGDANHGLARFAVPNPLGNNSATLTMPAVELTGGQSLICPISGQLCTYPPIAITQDSTGALYVADASNRVAIHYPALAGTNGASFVCAMGCNLGGLSDANYYLAPGAFTTLYTFGGPFASGVTASPVPYKTTLAGVQVLMDGRASPIQYVSSSQINFIVPFEAPTSGTAQVVVQNASTSQVLASGTMAMNVATPGFFIRNPAPGQTPAAGQIAAENCNKTPCDNIINSSSNPAQPGSVIQLFLTGQGLISGAPPDGQGSTGTVNTGSIPNVYIGGSLGKLTYSGLAPGYPGLWQINVQIPSASNLTNLPGFPAGTFPVQISYQGLLSNVPDNNKNPALATTISINAPE